MIRPHARTFGMLTVLMATVIGVAVVPADGSTAVAEVGVSATLTIDGRGNGHGIGMSQWGAYGYAADRGWSAAQILDHYYSGTVSGTTDATSITVRLMNLDDQQTTVVHDRSNAAVDGVAGGPWRTLVIREVADRSYTVWGRTDVSVCPAASDPLTGWTVVAVGLPSVTVRPAVDTSASEDMTDLLGACEASGRVRSYRGALRAVNGTAGENRTVNEVPLEQYLRSIVASEMSASWAPRGSQALQAQAVAARSFGLAENRYSYAKTCDQICQYYPGAASRASLSSAFTRHEHASVDAAVRATAGLVRRVGTAAGPIALTMFSSSSGGWTAPSTLPFAVVEDLGDATSGNPHHRWTVTVSTTLVEQKWPLIGTFAGVTVTRRSGHGEWGGRAQTVVVTGSAGSVTLSGDVFRRGIGLRSDWFSIAGAAPAPAPSPTPAPAPAPAPAPVEHCAGRVAPPVTSVAVPRPAARFEPSPVPVRLIDTRDGTGTTVAPLKGGCTLVVRPDVPAGTTAVAVTFVTVDTAAQGYLTAYPCGIERPFTSAVQSRPGRLVSGAAIVPLGAGGTFCVFSNTTTELVVDLTGSYSPSGSARYQPITAQRRFDSRSTGVRLAAGSVIRVSTRGQGAGAADSTAASLTIHALDAMNAGFITAWPCDRQRPWASSANVNAGESATNSADVAVSASGEVCLFVSSSMHLAVDVSGWFGPSATTDFYAVVPFRLADSREGHGWTGLFQRNVARPLQVAGVGGLPGGSVVRSVAAQFTAVGSSTAGFVTVHPCLPTAPAVSMLRFVAGTNTAALVNSVTSAAGRWCVVSNQPTHLVVDVSGWFG